MNTHTPWNCLCVICQTFRQSDKTLDQDGDKAQHVNRLVLIMDQARSFRNQRKMLHEYNGRLRNELAGDHAEGLPLELPLRSDKPWTELEALVKIFQDVCGETVEQRRTTRNLLRGRKDGVVERLAKATLQVASREKAIIDRDAEIKDLRNDLGARSQTIFAKDNELNAIRVKLKTANTNIRALEMKTWEQSRVIKAKEAELSDITINIDDNWARSMQLMQEAVTKDEEIAILRNKIMETSATKAGEMSKLRARIIALESQLDQDKERPHKRYRASSLGL